MERMRSGWERGLDFFGVGVGRVEVWFAWLLVCVSPTCCEQMGGSGALLDVVCLSCGYALCAPLWFGGMGVVDVCGEVGVGLLGEVSGWRGLV
jgi:hypothetical protein